MNDDCDDYLIRPCFCEFTCCPHCSHWPAQHGREHPTEPCVCCRTSGGAGGGIACSNCSHPFDVHGPFDVPEDWESGLIARELEGDRMSRPRLLDLFCGAGGAAMGYHRAGFDVVGVDIEPQPHYPFRFMKCDALTVLETLVLRPSPEVFYDVIHASPPCQVFTSMSARWRGRDTLADRRVDLLTPTIDALRLLGLPYVVENIVPARKHMSATLLLHGGMFGLGVHRPRIFECSELILAPVARSTINPVGVYGAHPQRHLKRGPGVPNRAENLAQAQAAMGMDWGDWHGVKEAIPPAYTEHIGRQLLEHLEVAAAWGNQERPESHARSGTER